MKKSNPTTNPRRGFGWGAALLGGATAIAGAAFFGTLLANLTVRMAMTNGLSRDQAYASLASSSTSITVLLTLLTIAVPGAVGGYFSAKHGRGHPLVQGGGAGAIALLFVVVMYFNPSSQPGPPWFVAISVITPLASSLLGSLLYRRQI